MGEEIIDISTATVRKSKRIPSVCKICGAPALYKYFGAVVCQSCKIFFRRNAQTGAKTPTCNFSGNCEININNRHVCTSCRLVKCFGSGMKIEMIRCSRQKKTVKPVLTALSTARMTANEQNQLHTGPICNLLSSDQLELNADQQNLLSNLIHRYEEYNALSHIQQFIQKQTSLPIKLRFKVASIDGLFESILSGIIELFFKSNNDFLSLSSHDRSILLRCAMENAGSFAAVLVFRQAQLFDQPDISKSIETIYGSIVMNLTKRLLNEVDRDITFVKLGIAMFAFSTTNCASYTNVGLDYLKNIKDILRIQNMYAEVAWKYLLYKCNHTQAVICFTNFIKSLLLVNIAVIEIHQSQHHKRMVANLIEKIDQQVTINS